MMAIFALKVTHVVCINICKEIFGIHFPFRKFASNQTYKTLQNKVTPQQQGRVEKVESVAQTNGTSVSPHVASAPPEQRKERIFFPNLDGVRAIAAMLVVVWHIELTRHGYIAALVPIPDVGHVGVSI